MRFLCNSIFPSYCLLCDSTGSVICQRCRSHFFRFMPHCFICGRLNSGFAPHSRCLELKPSTILFSFTCWRENGYARKVVKKINDKSLYRGLYYLTDLCIENVKATSFLPKLKNAQVVSIPSKNFDMSDYIGRRLADRLDLRYIKNVSSLGRGAGKVLIVGNSFSPKAFSRYAKSLKVDSREIEILSLSLFRRITVNKVRNVNPINP